MVDRGDDPGGGRSASADAIPPQAGIRIPRPTDSHEVIALAPLVESSMRTFGAKQLPCVRVRTYCAPDVPNVRIDAADARSLLALLAARALATLAGMPGRIDIRLDRWASPTDVPVRAAADPRDDGTSVPVRMARIVLRTGAPAAPADDPSYASARALVGDCGGSLIMDCVAGRTWTLTVMLPCAARALRRR